MLVVTAAQDDDRLASRLSGCAAAEPEARIHLALRHRPDRALAVIELREAPDLASWAADLGLPAEALSCYRVSEALRWSRPGVRFPADGGISMISFVQRAADMEPEQFERYWTEVHRPLAIQHHQGMLRYVQNVVKAPPEGAALDGIAELVFAAGSDVDAGLFPTEESRRIIGEDVARFIGSTTSGLYRLLE